MRGPRAKHAARISQSEMPTVAAYRDLTGHLRRMALVGSTHELLAWDELTLLPDEATEHRGRQIACLAGMHHALATDPRIEDWLAAIEGSPLVADPGGAAAINVREVRRQHRRLLKLPRSLVEELARVATAAQHAWKLAREESDFARFEPWLATILVLKREEARCLAEGNELYDALLADYEPGLTTADVRSLFAQLEPALTALVGEIAEAQRRSPAAAGSPLLAGRFPIDGQRRLCGEVAAALGFDLTRGRIDTAVHPFTSHLGPHDCRLAIRYDEGNVREALFALLHELGHGLYDQGLSPEHFGTPAGEGASLSVHESQARLWENAVGRSLGFWKFCLPRLLAAFPDGCWSRSEPRPEDIYREVNRVEPGTNRVAADEATYNLHILLRLDLELALLGGDLPTADLPAAWNERQRALLNVTPASDREGVLQDGHWAAGMFGYFPTYTVGNVLAAQLFQRATDQLGDLDGQFAAGDFQPLRHWLAAAVYRQGKRWTTPELCREVCGRGLDPQVLLETLRAKHQRLW